jgi:hypothetical protein
MGRSCALSLQKVSDPVRIRNIGLRTFFNFDHVSPLPVGEPGFPLNGVYMKPNSPEEADLMRQYFLQLRHETGTGTRTAAHRIQIRVEGRKRLDTVSDLPNIRPGPAYRYGYLP